MQPKSILKKRKIFCNRCNYDNNIKTKKNILKKVIFQDQIMINDDSIQNDSIQNDLINNIKNIDIS